MESSLGLASLEFNNQKGELETSSIREAFIREDISLCRCEAQRSTGLIWSNEATESLMWLARNSRWSE
jgi:hypothetical protein